MGREEKSLHPNTPASPAPLQCVVMPQYPPSSRTIVHGDVFKLDRAFALLSQVENTMYFVRQELRGVNPELAKEAMQVLRIVEAFEDKVENEMRKLTGKPLKDLSA